jgi:mannose-P-dolichol utilization defect protein 1
LLSYGIVTFSLIVKLPQILKLTKAKSGGSVSLSSVLMETFCLAVGSIYNLKKDSPFMAYGESFFIAVQNLLIVQLISKRISLQAALLAIYGLLYTLSIPHLAYLQWLCVFLGALSKIPQILTIFRQKTTYSLSFTTVFLQLVGSLARIFTTYMQIKDPAIMAGFIAAFILNGVITCQFFLYPSHLKKS